MKKIKFNKKQKKIMRFGAVVLFSVALILALSILFKKEDNSADFIGEWMIGYNIYEEGTNNLLSKIVQKLHIVNGGTFYTDVDGENSQKVASPVSGTYTVNEDKIILTFEQLGKKTTKTLYLNKDNRLCIDNNCKQYYEKGGVQVYYNFTQKSQSGDSN